MCKDSKDTPLNLHCCNCGSSNIKQTGRYKFVHSELGLSNPKHIYKCNDCNEEFLICPNCNGTGFDTTDLCVTDYDDCNICNGMGLVNIKNFEN